MHFQFFKLKISLNLPLRILEAFLKFLDTTFQKPAWWSSWAFLPHLTMTFDSEGGIYGEGGFGVPTAPYQQVWSLNQFYFVVLSHSRICVKKWVSLQTRNKVCVICFWRCTENDTTNTTRLTVSLYL